MGSSRTMTAAGSTHWAIATRARWPPERVPIFCCRSASENCSIDRNRFTLFFVAVNASESG